MMRGTCDVCLFCRQNSNSRNLSRKTRGFASERQREPYIIPRLVIDLDAAHSKVVRKFENFKEWSPSSLKKRLFPHHEETKTQPKKNRFQILRTATVTPPDLLTFALVGDPKPYLYRKTQDLRQIYRCRKLQVQDEVHSKILQLTSEFKPNAAEWLGGAGFQPDRENGIIWQLWNGPDIYGFPHLVRMVSMMSSTREGCLFMAANGAVLFSVIRNCRKNQGRSGGREQASVSSEMVLNFLNNLRINMESKGVEIGPGIGSTALYYAAKCWNLPAIRIYLQIFSDNSYHLSKGTYRAFAELVMHLLYAQEKALGPIGSETIRLLTSSNGSSKSIPQSKTMFFPSIVHRNRSSIKLCITYWVGLAELGLTDTLKAEWQNESKFVAMDSNRRRVRTQVFALACHVGGETDFALNILESVSGEDTTENITSEDGHPANAQSERDASVTHDDMVFYPPQSMQSLQLWTFKWFMRTHDNFHNVHPSDELLSTLDVAIKNLPDNPRDMLNSFEKFIVRDYRAPLGPGSRYTPKRLHWVDDSGLEGLTVLSERGDTPLYWKPAN